MDNNERKRKQAYYCRECGYKSDRLFNVERHTKRIHSESITKKCCNILFFIKSDYYHHIEDYHPGMRASCFVSKKKYKICGRKLKLSTDFSNKTKLENTVNSNNISDKCTTKRRSMRIQERVVKKGKLSLKETSIKSEYDDDMDIDDYDYDEHEELTHDLHNYQRMDSLSLGSEDHENSIYEKSGNNDDNTNNNYYQNVTFHDSKHIQKRYMNNSQNNIHCTETSLSCLEESSSENKENLNIMSRLPLKKRILCEINDNVNNNFIPNNKEMNIKKVSFDDKENKNPIDIFLNENQSATIVKQVLTVEQAFQMWNNITQRQRDYLRYIDFNSLE